MSLANDDVRRIAALARIAITADESAEVLERLNRVLALIDEMRAVNVARALDSTAERTTQAL